MYAVIHSHTQARGASGRPKLAGHVIGQAPGLDFGPGRNPDGQGYAVFGHVVEGMDIVRGIDAAAASRGDGLKKGQVLDKVVPVTTINRLPKAPADGPLWRPIGFSCHRGSERLNSSSDTERGAPARKKS